jgi:hypothetical protein
MKFLKSMHNMEVASYHTDTSTPETTQRILTKLGTGGSFQKVVHPHIHLNSTSQKFKASLIIFLKNIYHITSVHLFRVNFNEAVITSTVWSLLNIQFKQPLYWEDLFTDTLPSNGRSTVARPCHRGNAFTESPICHNMFPLRKFVQNGYWC